MNEEQINKIKYYINKKKTVAEISKDLGIETYEVYGIVQELKNNGEMYDIVNGEIVKLLKPKNVNDIYTLDSLNQQSLLLISDTHLASKYDRLDILRYLYKEAKEKGITTVLHSGDITDGYYPNRANHIYELKAHGADQQTDYVVQNYPHEDGIKTLFIAGNHDFTHIRNDGYDIGKSIGKQREDLIYLGSDVADVKIGKLKIRLFHGASGRAYAKSYKLQKYVESIPQDEKPHIVCMGHYHDAFFMKYQDVTCFQVPAILDQTPFARQQGMVNLKGAWWVDINYNKNGEPIQTTQTLETFGNKKLVKQR